MIRDNAQGAGYVLNTIMDDESLSMIEIGILTVIVRNTIGYGKLNGYIKADKFRLSHSSRNKYMQMLRDKGWISYKPTKQFTLYEILKVDDRVRKYLKGTAVPSDNSIDIISKKAQEKDFKEALVEIPADKEFRVAFYNWKKDITTENIYKDILNKHTIEDKYGNRHSPDGEDHAKVYYFENYYNKG